MFSWIRKRATYANVALTLALVFAMTGGAYAAKKYLITSTKQISPSVLKQLVGKTGPAGANGKEGAPGAQGPQGPAGANGKDGTNGTNGADGKEGAKGATGQQGQTGLKGTNGTNGTNGVTGTSGATGSPWAAGGTLPVGSTETGDWAMGDGKSEGGHVYAAISFPIPLASPLDGEHVQSNPVIYPTGATEEQEEHCPGSVNEPKAASGYLCLYAGHLENSVLPFVAAQRAEQSGGAGTDTSGALLFVLPSGAGSVIGFGTWAVTG